MSSWFNVAKIAAILALGMLGLWAWIMWFIAGFRHTERGSVTAKTIWVGTKYFLIGTIALSAAVVIFDPDKLKATFFVLIMCLFASVLRLTSFYIQSWMFRTSPIEALSQLIRRIKKMFGY
jgi:hypothetical protein